MKPSSTTRLFIPFLLILGFAVGGTALVASTLSPVTDLSHLLLLLAIPVVAAGLYYVILRSAFRTTAAEGKEDLSVTAGELEQLKASYATSLAHELRTPLNAIIGFTGIILQGMSGEINERQRDQLERVLDSAKRLLSMITDVIEIAKIDTGNAGNAPSTFGLSTVIEEIAHELQGRNQQDFKHITIEADVPQQIMLHTDRKKLRQCLINLIVCIVEYTDTKNITIAADKSGDLLDIIIGISHQEREQQSLAGLFRALETKRKEAGQKSGCSNIRLYLTARTITELLGGSISVDTQTSLRLGFATSITPASRQGCSEDPSV